MSSQNSKQLNKSSRLLKYEQDPLGQSQQYLNYQNETSNYKINFFDYGQKSELNLEGLNEKVEDNENIIKQNSQQSFKTIKRLETINEQNEQQQPLQKQPSIDNEINLKEQNNIKELQNKNNLIAGSIAKVLTEIITQSSKQIKGHSLYNISQKDFNKDLNQLKETIRNNQSIDRTKSIALSSQNLGILQEQDGKINKEIAERIFNSIFSKKTNAKQNVKPKKQSIGQPLVNPKVIVDKQEDIFRQKQQQEQLKNLAYDLGLDYQNEGELHKELLREMINEDLPQDWIIEFSPTSECIYYNTALNYSSKTHPYISQFRKILYKILNKQADAYVEEKYEEIVSSNKKLGKDSTKKLKKENTKRQKNDKTDRSIKSISSIKNINKRPSSIFSRMSSSSITQDQSISLMAGGSRNPSIMNQLQKKQLKGQQAANKIDELDIKSTLYDKKSQKREIYLQLRDVLRSNNKSNQEGNEDDQEENIEDQVKEINFQDFNKLIESYKLLYIDEYSSNPQTVYELIIQDPKYQAAQLNDIIARMASSVELPQYWIEVQSETEGRIYYNKLYKEYLFVHPGIEYFRFILQESRQMCETSKFCTSNDLNKNTESFQQKEQRLMQLQDKLGRYFEIDIEDYILFKFNSQPSQNSKKFIESFSETKIEAPIEKENIQITNNESIELSRSNSININGNNSLLQQSSQNPPIVIPEPEKNQSQKNEQSKIKNMFDAMAQVIWDQSDDPSKQGSIKNTEQLRQNIINSQLYYQTKDYDGDNDESYKNNLYGYNSFKIKPQKKRKNSNLCDEHMLVLCSQLNIKFPEKVHVLSLLYEYLSVKETLPQFSQWRFRINEKKEYFWINKQLRKSQNHYPFLSELKMAVDVFDKSVNHKQKYAKQKHNFSKLYDYFDENVGQQNILESISKYSRSLVKSYLTDQENQDSIVKQPLKKLIGILRSNTDIDETKLKNDILFNWRYSLQQPFLLKQFKENKLQHSKQLLKGPSPLEIIQNPMKYGRVQAEGYYFSSSEYISSDSNTSSEESSSSESESESQSDSVSSVSDEEENVTMIKSQKFQSNQIQKNSLANVSKQLLSQRSYRQQNSFRTTEYSTTNFTDNQESISQCEQSKNKSEDKSDSEDSLSDKSKIEESQQPNQQTQDNQQQNEDLITNQGGGNEDKESEQILQEFGIPNINVVLDNYTIESNEIQEKVKLSQEQDLSNTLDQSFINNSLNDSTKISINQTVNDTIDTKLQTSHLKEIKEEEDDLKLFQNYNLKLTTAKTEMQNESKKQNQSGSHQIEERLTPKLTDSQKIKDSKHIEKSPAKSEKLKVRQKSRELQKKLKNIVDKYKPDESILANMKNALKNKINKEGSEGSSKMLNSQQLSDAKHKRIQTNSIQKKTIQQRYSLSTKDELQKQNTIEDHLQNGKYTHNQDSNLRNSQKKEQKNKDDQSELKGDNSTIDSKKFRSANKSKKKKDEIKSSKLKTNTKSNQNIEDNEINEDNLKQKQYQDLSSSQIQSSKQSNLDSSLLNQKDSELQYKKNVNNENQSSLNSDSNQKIRSTKSNQNNIACENQEDAKITSQNNISNQEIVKSSEQVKTDKADSGSKRTISEDKDKQQKNEKNTKQDEQNQQNENEQDQNHENKLLRMFINNKKSKRNKIIQNLDVSQKILEEESEYKKVDSPGIFRQRKSIEINIIGDVAVKDNRRSTLLKNAQVIQQLEQLRLEQNNSQENIGEDITASNQKLFSFHQNKSETVQNQDSFQVMKIKNNYNVCEEDIVVEEEFEEFDENENKETLKQQEQSRQNRKRNYFASSEQRSSGINSIQDPLIRAQFDSQYRKMSLFQFQNIKLSQGQQISAQSITSQKKKFNQWRDKIQFTIESAKIQNQFLDKKDDQYKFDARSPKSYQFWLNEKKGQDNSIKALKILERVENNSEEKSILLSEFMPKKLENSAAYTKYDAVKINQEPLKQYNLENEIIEIKKKQEDPDFITNERREYERLTKEFYNINVPSLLNTYQSMQINQKNEENTKQNCSPNKISQIQSQFHFPVIQPLTAQKNKSLNNKIRFQNQLNQGKKLKNKIILENNQKLLDEIQPVPQAHQYLRDEQISSEIIQQKYSKIKDGVVKQINFLFQNNLRLHFIEKDVLEKEEKKIQQSVKQLSMWNNINKGQQEYDNSKLLKNINIFTNNQYEKKFIQNGINILKSANRLNRSLSPKTINKMKYETEKISSNLLPIMKNKSSYKNINNNLENNQIDKSSQNAQFNYIANQNSIFLPKIEKHQFTGKTISKSLERSPKANNSIPTILNQSNLQNLNEQQLEQIKIINNQSMNFNNNTMNKAINIKKGNTLVEQMQSLNKFEDNYTIYKLKAVVEKLMKKSNSGLLKFGNKQSEYDKEGEEFSKETQQQLDKLQLKYFKHKLDLLIFDIIVCAINLTKYAKKLLQDSEVLQSRFYTKFRKYFTAIRNEILQMPIIQNNYYKFLADPNFDISVIEQIYRHITQKCNNLFLEMKTINVLEATILYQMKQEANQHAAAQTARQKQQTDSEIKQLSFAKINEIASVNTINEANTFLDESQSSCDEDSYDSNPFKVNSNFFILNSQLFTDYLQSMEESTSGVRISSTEKQQLLSKLETKEQVKKKMNLLQNSLSSGQSIQLLLRFLKSQEQIEYFLKKNQIFKAQWNQLGKIHKINRAILQKFYCYLDTGLLPTHLYLMCKKMNIDIFQEGDLIWIAMLYCFFVIKFTQYTSIEALNYIISYDSFQQINKKKREILKDIQFIQFQSNHYDEFFNQLLEFNRVKRELLFLQLGQRQKQEYIEYQGWFKFYDEKNDTLYYLQPSSGVKKTRLNRLTINLQRKYAVLENAKFLEIVDIITLISRQDEILKISTSNNDNKFQQNNELQNHSSSLSLPPIQINPNTPLVKIIKFNKKIPPFLIDQQLKKERVEEITKMRREDFRRLEEIQYQEQIRKKRILEEQLRNQIALEMWNKSLLNNSQSEIGQNYYDMDDDMNRNDEDLNNLNTQIGDISPNNQD